MFRPLAPLAVSLCLAAAALVPTGCAATLTAPQATALHGTRPYPGQEPEGLASATRSALAALGYEVVSDEDAMPIKTAPKLVQVNAAGGNGAAVAAAAEIAWTIDIDATGETPTIVAEPRGYFGGKAQEKYNARWIEDAYATLFAEIDSSLPATDEAS